MNSSTGRITVALGEQGDTFPRPTVLLQGTFHGSLVLLSQLGATDTDIEVYVIRFPEKPDAVVYCWATAEDNYEGLHLLAFGEVGADDAEPPFDTAGMELFKKLILGDLYEDGGRVDQLAASVFGEYLATGHARSSTIWLARDFDPSLTSIHVTIGTLRAAGGMTTTWIRREALAFPV